MLECKVCGCKFNPVKQSHYIARDNEKASSLVTAFSSDVESTLHDAFDCPQCGCQIIAQARKRVCRARLSEKQVSLGSNWEDGDEDDKDGGESDGLQIDVLWNT